MARQSGSSLLEAAVSRWVETVLSRSPEDTNFHLKATPDLHAVIALSEEAEAGILEIGRQLPAPSPFRGPADLVQFLYDSLVSIIRTAPDGPPNAAQVAALLIERLADPLKRFRFRAPLTLRGHLSWSGAIGGPHELALEALERDGEIMMMASGTVEAPTEPTALVTIEEILQTVLGLALALDLCSMLAPLPGAAPSVSLEIAPYDAAIPSRLSGEVSAGISGALFRVPQSLTELERHHIRAGDIERGLGRHVRFLSWLMGSTEPRALELRSAGALLLRASISADLGLALTYCFMCLEGVLLDRSTTDNVLGRLVEAIAYRIGTSSDHRAELRREVKDLYNLRSRYVHTGDAGVAAWTRPRERCLAWISTDDHLPKHQGRLRTLVGCQA
jgi:hypothetical protein